MTDQPTAVQLTPTGQLQIHWSDGVRVYEIRDLREACPCATCREKRGAAQPSPLFPVLSEAELQPLTIASMEPLGNYAYHIAFSDGHDTGIFTLERLRSLGQDA